MAAGRGPRGAAKRPLVSPLPEGPPPVEGGHMGGALRAPPLVVWACRARIIILFPPGALPLGDIATPGKPRGAIES
jgi:hypothetical protein